MITRRIGKLLRGNATPAQIFLACLIGGMLGFMPTFGTAAGLIVLLTLGLIVLNANLVLAAFVGLAAKAISIPLLPVSFAAGRVLLDGPTQPLFKAAVNAPVLALFGFEYYATTGGLLLGAVFGLACGFAAVALLRRFRTAMAGLEAGNEKYKQWAGKGWVKALTWIFFGGGPKGGYAEAMQRKGGVIRPVGVVVAVLFVGLLVIVQMFFAGPIVTAVAQRSLERANGATVDLASAEVDLPGGTMVVTGLAMADPNALDTDLLRAERVEIDISAADLLRKRARLDRVVLIDAQNGVKRTVPGRLVGPPPKAPPAPPETAEGEKTIEDYIADAKAWKERLAQVREWYEKVNPDPGPAPGTADETAAGDEPLKDRLRRRIAELGYARVSADHLITGAPTLTITELVAEKVRTAQLDGETLGIHGQNLSTHPHLLDVSPSISVKSSGDTLKLALDLAGASAAGGESKVDFALRKLPVERVAGALTSGGGEAPIAGGTFDVSLAGTLPGAGAADMDLPLAIALHDTTLNVAGRSQKVERFDLTLGLRGPLDNPRIALDQKQLTDALVKAGAGELTREARAKADAEIQKATGKLTDKLGEKLGGNAPKLPGDVTKQAEGALKGLFGGEKK